MERCQGAGCTNFAQIATPAGTTFGDTGLTAATNYSYRVKAVDAATNVSVNYSTVATATTQAASGDTTPPSTVDRPDRHRRQQQADQSELDGRHRQWWSGRPAIAWSAVRGRAARPSRRSPRPTTNSYSDPGLTAGTSYSYRVPRRRCRRQSESELLEHRHGHTSARPPLW